MKPRNAHRFLILLPLAVALGACAAEIDTEPLRDGERDAAIAAEEEALAAIEDCAADLADCVDAAAGDPAAMAACAVEAATCAGGGGGVVPPVPIPPVPPVPPIPPVPVPPIPDVPDVDLDPLLDCQDEVLACVSGAATPADIQDCIADGEACANDATSGLCDSAAELCNGLPLPLPICDQVGDVCP